MTAAGVERHATPGAWGTKLRLAVFGTGVVGGGVLKLVENDERFRVVVIFVRDKAHARQRYKELPAGVPLIDAVEDIFWDDFDCVVELMGGVTVAWTIIQSAIRRGKHVVTANKALMSKYLSEICELLKEHPRVHFAFEAAVAGGIPIINTIQRGLAGDEIYEIRAILNGTCNYVLSVMEKGITYDEALKNAQRLGYAESDPTMDVEGFDARSKAIILAYVAFGKIFTEESVSCVGISRLTQMAFKAAEDLNCTIRLVATITADKPPIVEPVVIPLASALSRIDGATNYVHISSKNLGNTVVIGPGAGRFPTANSVLADLIELAHRKNSSPIPGCHVGRANTIAAHTSNLAKNIAPIPTASKSKYLLVSPLPYKDCNEGGEFFSSFKTLEGFRPTPNYLGALVSCDESEVSVNKHTPQHTHTIPEHLHQLEEKVRHACPLFLKLIE